MNRLPLIKKEVSRSDSVSSGLRLVALADILKENAENIREDRNVGRCSDDVFETTKLAMDSYTGRHVYQNADVYSANIEAFPEHADEPPEVHLSVKVSFLATTEEDAWAGLHNLLLLGVY